MSQQQTQSTGTRPVKVFRAGGISAAIFEREVKQDGRNVIQHSVQFEKRYYDRNARDFKDSGSYFPNDLPKLELVARNAFEFIMLTESDDGSDLPAT
jgi:hypothetical protein